MPHGTLTLCLLIVVSRQQVPSAEPRHRETLTLYVLIVVSRQQVPSAEPRHMEQAAGALPPAQGCAGCRQLHRCSVLSETQHHHHRTPCLSWMELCKCWQC